MEKMNRRSALRLFGQGLFLAAMPFQKLAQAFTQLLISTPTYRLVLLFDSKSQESYQTLLDKVGPLLTLRDPKWTQKLSLWDIQSEETHVKEFISRYGSQTDTFHWPILICVHDLNDTDVEFWNLHWVHAKEKTSRNSCYPVSGGWWSVDGDWNPSITKVCSHLFTSPNHKGGKFQFGYLEQLTFEELQSLHSDHHREMTGGGKVTWKKVNVECPV